MVSLLKLTLSAEEAIQSLYQSGKNYMIGRTVITITNYNTSQLIDLLYKLLLSSIIQVNRGGVENIDLKYVPTHTMSS